MEYKWKKERFREQRRGIGVRIGPFSWGNGTRDVNREVSGNVEPTSTSMAGIANRILDIVEGVVRPAKAEGRVTVDDATESGDGFPPADDARGNTTL